MSAPWIAAFVALSGLVVLPGVIVLGTLRRLIPLIERAETDLAAAAPRAPGAIAAGASIPRFSAKSVNGVNFTDFDLRRSRTVVLFVGASCAACERLVAGLKAGRVPNLDAGLVAISEDAEEAHRFAPSAHVTVVIDEQRSVAKAFESEIVPQAFVVEDGTVLASGRPNDWYGVETLVTSARRGGGDFHPYVAAEGVTSRWRRRRDGREREAKQPKTVP